MAKVITGQGGWFFDPPFGATDYFSPGHGAWNPGSEAGVLGYCRKAGTLSSLRVRCVVNRASSNSVFYSYINSAFGNLTLTVPAGAGNVGEFVDLVNSDAWVVGATLSIRGDAGATAKNDYSLITYVWTPTANSNMMYLKTTCVWAPAGTTTYFHLATSSPNATESNVSCRSVVRGVLNKIEVGNISSYAVVDVTVRSRITGANGNQLCTLPASTPGWYSDLVNEDTLAVGTLFSYSCTTPVGATGVGAGNLYCGIETTDNTYQIIHDFPSGTNLGNTYAAGVTVYETFIGGFPSPVTTTESDVQLTIGVTCSLDNYQMLVITNIMTSASTFRLRKNGANANGLISVPSGAGNVGYFLDLVSVDYFIPTDKVDWLFTLGTGTSLIVSNIGCRLNANNWQAGGSHLSMMGIG